MDEEQLTQEQMQALWTEEANKLDAGNEPPAVDALANVPENLDNQTPPQDIPAPAADPAPAPAEEPDPLEGLSPAVRAKLAQIDELANQNAQLLHHVKTTEGRVAAMQREAEQARRAATQVAAKDAPTQNAIASAAKNPEKWEQLKQDFPEWAGAMEEYVASKIGSAQPQPQGLTPEQVAGYVQQQVAQSRAEMGRLLEEARIEGKHENWRDTVNTTEFAQWFTVQGPDVQALASSSAAKDAIRMLDLFSDAKKRPAADIRQERSQRLSAAATTRPGQTPPPKSLDALSPEELWNHEAAAREKTRAQRGF